MNDSVNSLAIALLALRRESPAWRLLAAKRAPLMLSCLKFLFADASQPVAFEEATVELASLLAQYANDNEFEIGDDAPAVARTELRQWIKRGLLVERGGELTATDALQKALEFTDGLQQRIMTSSASRLAVVQREIENLSMALNPDPQARAAHIRSKIKTLQAELQRAEQGKVEVLEGSRAEEAIREVYNLSMGLRADFRRVEDSYRQADQAMRRSIIGDEQHRGAVVDKLLDVHDELLETPEGQVFDGFYKQLHRKVELDDMKQRLRELLATTTSRQALHSSQRHELRGLISSLVRESRGVIQARARSESDVKGFLQTGLAAEHHRVGQLLNNILDAAADIDWQSQKVRRSAAPLPPLGLALASVPVVERLRFKQLHSDDKAGLQLDEHRLSLEDVGDEFLQGMHGLDRRQWLLDTLALLKQRSPLTVAELAEAMPPEFDLETLALWLSMAREAGIVIGENTESVIVAHKIATGETTHWRFTVPRVALSDAALANIHWEL